MNLCDRGRLAQLGERIVRNDEAGGSNPLPSTNSRGWMLDVRGWKARRAPKVAERHPGPPAMHLCETASRLRMPRFALSLFFLIACFDGLLSRIVKAEPPAPHSVTLSWTASTSIIAGYNIYRIVLPHGSAIPIAKGFQGTQYTDKKVKAGRTYAYYVTAVDFKGKESVPSATVSVTVPRATTPANQIVSRHLNLRPAYTCTLGSGPVLRIQGKLGRCQFA